MKSLKELNLDKMSIRELFQIKGGVSSKQSCITLSCTTLSCTSKSCSSGSCSTKSCKSNSCRTSSDAAPPPVE